MVSLNCYQSYYLDQLHDFKKYQVQDRFAKEWGQLLMMISHLFSDKYVVIEPRSSRTKTFLVTFWTWL